jgi:protein phosphatase PTC1
MPDVLNETFHKVDESLSRMCEDSEGKIHSGCTAVVALLRIEDSDGRQTFINARPSSPPPSESPPPMEDIESSHSSGAENDESKKKQTKTPSGSRIKAALKSLTGAGGSGGGNHGSTISSPVTPRSSSPSRTADASGATITIPPSTARRVLYTANAGDARAVLCRGGKAIRLSYDHKGSDKREAKRIMDAGGFVMSGRVNGVLAVTRSLGDSSMKEFVVGSPYTTETELSDDDEFLILACDGVCYLNLPVFHCSLLTSLGP